jgi:phosphoglycerol transferase MdoB-like AlkP superfamily enzyme
VLRGPFALFSRFGRRPWVRGLGHGFFMAVAGVIAFAWVAEIFFWEEFDSRFNGVAVSYLIFPREVIGNLEESFRVSLYLPLFALFAGTFWWLVRARLSEALRYRDGKGTRLKRLGATLALAGLGVAMLHAEPNILLQNRELNQLARDGLQTMVSAALTNDAEYDGVFPGLPREQALATLRAMVQQDNTTFIDAPGQSPVLRRVVNDGGEKRLNIVLVTEETYGSVFVDSLDNPLEFQLSPDLDLLASKGLFFTNIYAQGDRTVRGLEATETGFAPIPGISTARRPGSDGMLSLAHLLNQRDYQTGVLYGGLNAFDNMGNFWRGIDYTNVWDQRDIRHESFSTIWGVSDEDLVTEALLRLDEMTATGRPAFLTLMTVSNHRPYKFPQTHVKWDDRLGNIQNTARYAQWAFADFVERARTKPWFKDTVFAFVADHSVKINGAARVPVNSFRIPMLFYSPAHIRPQRVDTLGAQMDLIPTLLGVLGFTYDSPFFGRDLMRVPKGDGRFTIAQNFSIALGRPGHVVVLQPNGLVEGYAFSAEARTLTPEEPDPVTLEMAIAQTQEAHRAFYSGRYHWR